MYTFSQEPTGSVREGVFCYLLIDIFLVIIWSISETSGQDRHLETGIRMDKLCAKIFVSLSSLGRLLRKVEYLYVILSGICGGMEKKPFQIDSQKKLQKSMEYVRIKSYAVFIFQNKLTHVRQSATLTLPMTRYPWKTSR